MNFGIKKNSLLRLLKMAAFISAEKKMVANVFGSQVLLRVTADLVLMVATDLDTELIIQEPIAVGSVQEEGAAVVPFRTIMEICRAMIEDVDLKVLVGSGGGKLQIESQQGFFSVNCLSATVFPHIAAKSFYASFDVTLGALRKLINKTAFAAGEEDSRLFLNGVFFKFAKDHLVAVAADGHRLAIWEESCSLSVSSEIKILVPKKSVFDLLKVFGDFPATTVANFSVGENYCKIIVEGITFTTKLLAAIFPAYQKLIPINLQHQLVTKREALKACFLRAAALLGDKTQGVRLFLSSNKLLVSAKNENNDEIEETLDVNYAGVAIEICFNIKYLLDFLSNLDGQEIILRLENAKSGVVFQEQGQKNTYMLMPMQL